MPKKQNVRKLKEAKNSQPIVMITAYDAIFAHLAEPHADIILVGDSLNMSFGANPDTLCITMDQMLYHTNAVCNGAPESFIVCDMPFGSYINKEIALNNSIRVYRESKADAVKIEGGKDKSEIISHLSKNGVAVMGHIGLMPQMVRSEGGYSIKGKDSQNIQKLVEDARAIEKAGVFCMVVEGVKSNAAIAIAKAVSVPVIGIGAGVEVDGQVLVWSDMLGFNNAHIPKFVKKYLNGAELASRAFEEFSKDVKERKFPTQEYSY